MKILYLADIRFPLERANGVQTMETCWALAERGHQVSLAVRADTVRPPRDPFEFYGLPARDTLVIRRWPCGSRPGLRRAMYLARAVVHALRGPRADVLLTRDLGLASLLVRLPARVRPRVVYESHGYAPAVGRELPELLNGAAAASARKQGRLLARERTVWTRADGYITITAGLARELAGRFGSRAQVAVIPDGVRLNPARQFALPAAHTPAVIGYAGHLYPWKGVEVVLQALALLPLVHGLVIGGHPGETDLARLKALAAHLSLESRVRFTGLLAPSQVQAALAAADILVLPNTSTSLSARYTSPLKLFEYLAAGKPIVASDLPSIREVVADGETAVLVAPGSAQALAAGVERVLADPDLAARLARRAFDVAAEYSWEKRAERIEAVLEAVMSASGAVRARDGVLGEGLS